MAILLSRFAGPGPAVRAADVGPAVGASLMWTWAAVPAVVVVGLLAVWHPVAGKAADVLQYIAQGTVVPLVLLAYVLSERLGEPPLLMR